MKKIIFMCMLMVSLTGISANAQQVNRANILPQRISKVFYEQYPSAFIIRYKRHNDGYAVKFRLEGKKHTAFYNPSGNWVKTTSKISFTRNLPQNISNAWKESEYRTWYIKYMTKIQNPDSSYYVFDVDNSSLLDADHMPVSLQENDLYFDISGKLIKNLRVE